MDIVLYSRPQSSYTAEDVAALFDALDRSGMGWRVNKDFASLAESLAGRSFAPDELYDDASQIDDRAQVMVSYGGDGTFLDCVPDARRPSRADHRDQLRTVGLFG